MELPPPKKSRCGTHFPPTPVFVCYISHKKKAKGLILVTFLGAGGLGGQAIIKLAEKTISVYTFYKTILAIFTVFSVWIGVAIFYFE